MIGAGPAGISAAIQLRKEGVHFDIYERKRIGGLLWYANRVDNLLGHRGRNGKVLCSMFATHLEDYGIDVKGSEITDLRRTDEGFMVNGHHYHSVILATGTSPKGLGIPGELHFVEDPSLYEGKDVLIVGAGDLAFDNALTLHDNNVGTTVIYRKRIKANSSLVEEVKRKGIRILKEEPENIKFEDGIYHLGDRSFNYLFVFIGRSPDLSLLSDMEHLKTHLPSFRTSVKGLYVIGDAALGTQSQTALASGSGLAAAMDIAKMVKDDEAAPRERT